MKRIILISCTLFISWGLFAQSPTVASQTNPTALGLPGDNLNLYLVLNLFKQSTSIEDFEKRLNSPDTKVNNLDLNNDGSVDYLKVTDYGKSDYHTIVIQDIVSASETQDVAIIQLQKNNGNLAHIQIVGDESLYGKNYIIEPQLDNAASVSTTPTTTAASQPTTVVNNNYYNTNTSRPAPYVNVWGWPCVSFMFGPSYIPWVSPWSWAYYPTWWYGRPRVIFSVYSGYYHDFGWGNYCRRDVVINQVRYNNYYNSHRVISNTVQTNITKNVYKNNYNENNTINNNSGVHTSSYPKNNFAPDKNYNSQPNKQGATNNATNFGGTQKENPIKTNQIEKQNTPSSSTPKYGYGSNNAEWGGNNKPQKEEQGTQGSNPKWNNNNTAGNNNAEWGGYNKHTNSTTPDPVYNNKPSKQFGNNGNPQEGYAPKGNSSSETPKSPKWNNGGNNGGGGKWNNGGGGYKGGGNHNNNSGGHWGGGNGGGVKTGERRK